MSHRQIDTDALFEILANERRRRLLVDLLERTPRREVSASSGRPAAAGALRRTQPDLYHVHLPKMQAAGLVRWDAEADDVTKGPEFERSRPALELLTEHAEKLPSGWT